MDCLTFEDGKEAVSTSYQHTPRNNPEKRRLELHSSWSLKSCTADTVIKDVTWKICELVSYLTGVNSTWTENSGANFITDYQHLLHPVAQTPEIFPFPTPHPPYFPGLVLRLELMILHVCVGWPPCLIIKLPTYTFSVICAVFFITLFEIHVLLYSVYA